MLSKHHRRWLNIKPTLAQRLVLAGLTHDLPDIYNYIIVLQMGLKPNKM